MNVIIDTIVWAMVAIVAVGYTVVIYRYGRMLYREYRINREYKRHGLLWRLYIVTRAVEPKWIDWQCFRLANRVYRSMSPDQRLVWERALAAGRIPEYEPGCFALDTGV